VLPRTLFRNIPQLNEGKPIRIAPGQSVALKANVPAMPSLDPHRFELEPLPGLPGDPNALTLRADGQAKPRRGNLIVAITASRPAGPGGKPPAVARIPLGYMPAVAFEIVPQ